ncbi:MAG TPA: SET domain-containing protein-lysine N-methyltransferase [Bryobacteraceae bacterium]|jgi:SET domain-containing protein
MAIVEPVYQLKFRNSKIHGRGVFAAENIPANRKVIEYTGERISAKHADQRGHGDCTYYFSLDRYWVLDGSVGGSGAELINHSCGPNLISRIMKGHILYMSLRKIRAGEELTVDYHFSKKDEKTPCHCKAKNCRKTINLL